jgi:ABC-type dipeptide/oligopeptide/nickel transport system ATPase component
LLSAVPVPHPDAPRVRAGLPVVAQDSDDAGCAFAARCAEAHGACRTVRPVLRDTGDEGGRVACHLFAHAPR